jgi:hypothetical protein
MQSNQMLSSRDKTTAADAKGLLKCLSPDAGAMAKWISPNGFACSVHHIDVKVSGRFKMSFADFATGPTH